MKFFLSFFNQFPLASYATAQDKNVSLLHTNFINLQNGPMINF